MNDSDSRTDPEAGLPKGPGIPLSLGLFLFAALGFLVGVYPALANSWQTENATRNFWLTEAAFIAPSVAIGYIVLRLLQRRRGY